MTYYLYIFYIFSIFGYLFESLLALIKGVRIHSGIFLGPWCPVYGIGIVLIIIVFRYIEMGKFSFFLKLFLMFLSAFILLSVIEAIGGILIEKVFNITFWNYTPFKFNIGKYIALEISLAWGIMSLLIYFFLVPLADKLIKILPNFLLYALVIISVIDIVWSSVKLLKK